MESLTQSIQQPLQLLIYTSVILIIITGVFLIKLLIELSGLINSMQIFVKATQEELEPTIKELKNTLVNINQISSNVTNQITNMNIGIKKGAQTVLESGAVIGSRLKEVGKVLGQVVGKKVLSGFYLMLTRKR